MSRDLAAIKMAREIVQIHERSIVGSVEVVSIVVDDLAPVAHLLKGLALMLEGAVLDTSAEEMHDPTPSTDDPVRVAAVKTSLTTPAPNARSVQLAENPAGVADWSFVGQAEGAEISPGEAMVLALARAFAHRDLDDHEFAVILYSAASVDIHFRQAAWALAVDQFDGMASARLRTLVVVCESSIDIPAHCQPSKGLRLGLEAGRFVRRHSRTDLMVTVAQVVAHQDPLVLFLGAGFPISSRLPLGDSLRNSAIRRLLGLSLGASTSPHELARRFHDWIAAKDGWRTESEENLAPDDYISRLTLEQVIRAEQTQYGGKTPTLEEFRERHDQVLDHPGQSVVDLCEWIGQKARRLVVVSLNFDELIERHAGDGVRRFATDDEFEDAGQYLSAYLNGDEEAVPLLKVHGTISEPSSCVVSAEQTDKGVGAGKLKALEVAADVGSNDRRLWIYVGASMRDRDLLPVLIREDFGRALDERWVMPYLPESVEAFAMIRQPMWKDQSLTTLDDRLVSEGADTFFRLLLDRSTG